MTTQKEKNVLDFKDKDILKNHKVADKDDEWFHEQWKNIPVGNLMVVQSLKSLMK